MSEYAIENILNAVKVLDIDHIFHSYNWHKLKKCIKQRC